MERSPILNASLLILKAEKDKNKPVVAAKEGKPNKVNEEEISPNEYFKLRFTTIK